jgi:hypothetical protein
LSGYTYATPAVLEQVMGGLQGNGYFDGFISRLIVQDSATIGSVSLMRLIPGLRSKGVVDDLLVPDLITQFSGTASSTAARIHGHQVRLAGTAGQAVALIHVADDLVMIWTPAGIETATALAGVYLDG